jgi:hypothetical protein
MYPHHKGDLQKNTIKKPLINTIKYTINTINLYHKKLY